MGAIDMERQAPNVARMRLLGAEVVPVTAGTQTLKDATSEAIRDWMTQVRTTHYLIGSVVGPHPYPLLVRSFASRIGMEARIQVRKIARRLPHVVIACVGGGSNAIGIMHAFLKDESVRLYGVEAGGRGAKPSMHAATLKFGSPGVLHGAYSYLLQNAEGQVAHTHSISAGLDYPGVGPELAELRDRGRVQFVTISDDEALAAFGECARHEGIIPALESTHALAFAKELCPSLTKNSVVLINLSGRGDKDLAAATQALQKPSIRSNRQRRLQAVRA
jgi:tryptophan synthase beta chain